MKKNKLLMALGTFLVGVLFLPIRVSAQDTYIKEEYQDICYTVAEEYNISPYLLMALIETESSGRADVSDCVTGTHHGLMQLSEVYFGGDGIDLFDPETNIRLGTEYLVSCDDDIGIALMVYHGEADARTRDGYSKYATTILERSAEIEAWHETEEEQMEVNTVCISTSEYTNLVVANKEMEKTISNQEEELESIKDTVRKYVRKDSYYGKYKYVSDEDSDLLIAIGENPKTFDFTFGAPAEAVLPKKDEEEEETSNG